MVNNYISNDDEESNKRIPLIVSILLCLLSIIPIIILLVTQLKYKKKKIKEDILLIERYFLYIIFIVITLIFQILKLMKINDTDKLEYYTLLFFINIYIVNILSVVIEFCKEVKNPFYILLSIFSNKKKNVTIEIFTILTSPALFLLGYFLKNSPLKISDNESYYSINGLIALTMIIIIIILIITTCKFSGIQNKSKATLRTKFFSLYIVSIFLLIYSGANFLLHFQNELLKHYIQHLITYSTPLVIIFIDCISTMLYIKSSDYYFYYLGKRKNISKFYKMCCKTKYYKPPIYEHVTNNDVKKEIIMDTFQDTLEFNNISQLNIELCEYSLNVALSSISIIFDKIRKEINDNSPAKNNISSQKNKQNEDILVNLLDQYNTKNSKEKCKHFTLNKKDFEDNKLGEITNVSTNVMDKDKKTYNNNLNVELDYYYYDKFISGIINRNIDLNEVKTSMLSHTQSFPFLISMNAKESYFKTTKTLSIKTSDRKIMIEIFPDILDNKSNQDIVESYINHMNLIKKANDKTIMKENEILSTVASATFLPCLLGVFKVKINSFSSFTVFISKNTILENAPSDVFNFWQLMRYNYGDHIEKISTSKDKTSICITEDNLFNGMKIMMRNYKLFSDTLINDFEFLKQINAKNFSLLIMYYEFDQSISKSLSIDQNEEISKIRITASNFRVSDIKNFNFPEEGENETISDLDKDISIVKYNKDGNGFEAKFNNFRAIMFFCFENIFEFRGHSWKRIDYTKYRTDLLKNFDYMNLEDE